MNKYKKKHPSGTGKGGKKERTNVQERNSTLQHKCIKGFRKE